MNTLNPSFSIFVLCSLLVCVVSPASFHVQWKAPGTGSIISAQEPGCYPSTASVTGGGGAGECTVTLTERNLSTHTVDAFVVSTAHAVAEGVIGTAADPTIKENSILRTGSQTSPTEPRETSATASIQPPGTPTSSQTSPDVKTPAATTDSNTTDVTLTSSSTTSSDVKTSSQNDKTKIASTSKSSDVTLDVTASQNNKNSISEIPDKPSAVLQKETAVNPTTTITQQEVRAAYPAKTPVNKQEIPPVSSTLTSANTPEVPASNPTTTSVKTQQPLASSPTRESSKTPEIPASNPDSTVKTPEVVLSVNPDVAKSSVTKQQTSESSSATKSSPTIDGCPRPPVVRGATPRYQSTSVGSVVFYECNSGNPRKQALSVCTFDHTWTPVALRCPANECPAILPLVEGVVTSVSDMSIGALAVFTCDVAAGYTYLSGGKYSECGQDGAWTVPSIKCVKPASASSIQSTQNKAATSTADTEQSQTATSSGQPGETSGGQTFLNFSRNHYKSPVNQADPPTFLNFRRHSNSPLPSVQPQHPPSHVNPSVPEKPLPPTQLSEQITNGQSTSVSTNQQQQPIEASSNTQPLTPPINKPSIDIQPQTPPKNLHSANQQQPVQISSNDQSLTPPINKPSIEKQPQSPPTNLDSANQRPSESSSNKQITNQSPSSPTVNSLPSNSEPNPIPVTPVEKKPASTPHTASELSNSPQTNSKQLGSVPPNPPATSSTNPSLPAKSPVQSETPSSSSSSTTTTAAAAAAAAPPPAVVPAKSSENPIQLSVRLPLASETPAAAAAPPPPPPPATTTAVGAKPPILESASTAASSSKSASATEPSKAEIVKKSEVVAISKSQPVVKSTLQAIVPRPIVNPPSQTPARNTAQTPAISQPATQRKPSWTRGQTNGQQDTIPQRFLSPQQQSKGRNSGGRGRQVNVKPKSGFPGNLGQTMSSYQGLSNAQLDAMISQELNKAKSTWGAALPQELQKFLFGSIGMPAARPRGSGSKTGSSSHLGFPPQHFPQAPAQPPVQNSWKKLMTSQKHVQANQLQPFSPSPSQFGMNRRFPSLLSNKPPVLPPLPSVPLDAEAMLEQQEDILKARALLNKHGQSPLKKKVMNQVVIDQQLAAIQAMEQQASDIPPPPAHMLGLGSLFKEPSYPSLNPFENPSLAALLEPPRRQSNQHLRFQQRQQRIAQQQQQQLRQSNQLRQQPRSQRQPLPTLKQQQQQQPQLPRQQQKPYRPTAQKKTSPFDFMKMLMGQMGTMP